MSVFRHCSIVSNPWTRFVPTITSIRCVSLDGETFLERVHPRMVTVERPSIRNWGNGEGGSWNAKDCRSPRPLESRIYWFKRRPWGDGKALKGRWILGGKRKKKVYSLSRILREGWNIALVVKGWRDREERCIRVKLFRFLYGISNASYFFCINIWII